jgi:AcrR family transcriptional regulator
MSSRVDQKAETRRQLVKVALSLSSEKGFSALSLREVATGAGITAAGFYRHFRDMEELGLTLLDEVGLSLRRFLRDARKRVAPGPTAVKVSVDAFLTFVNENPNLFRLLMGERQGSTSTFRKAIHTEMDRFISELSLDLDRLHSLTDQPLRNSSFSAEAIVSIVFTVGAEALDLPKHKQSGLADRLVEEIKMVLRGSLRPTLKKKKAK